MAIRRGGEVLLVELDSNWGIGEEWNFGRIIGMVKAFLSVDFPLFAPPNWNDIWIEDVWEEVNTRGS